ncbi:hypothetical protein VTK73DRAFT_7131 [Phialemonium thermophilum]|uniref:GTP cyclohydrolase 1 n=1 Tax=Phialemonium thermophilum TaxID=223376 RepID=A0ABR3WG63_9PEZI
MEHFSVSTNGQTLVPIQQRFGTAKLAFNIHANGRTPHDPAPRRSLASDWAESEQPTDVKSCLAGIHENQRLSKVSKAVEDILEALGEDKHREGLVKTPTRFAKAMLFFTKGYGEDPTSVLEGAIFHESNHGLVLVKDIEFSSLCEHHLVPFVGKVHLAYLPNGRVVGLSKVARIVEVFARRFQVQERLTREIADSMFDILKPLGVAVVIEATHFCMVMRGVQKLAASTTTTCMLGEFQTNREQREDFWRTLNRPT